MVGIKSACFMNSRAAGRNVEFCANSCMKPINKLYQADLKRGIETASMKTDTVEQH